MGGPWLAKGRKLRGRIFFERQLERACHSLLPCDKTAT